MYLLYILGKMLWRGIEGYDKSIASMTSCQQYSDEKLLLGENAHRIIFTNEDLKLWKAAVLSNPLVRQISVLGVQHS